MTETFVTLEKTGSKATITVRRPKALNALNAEVLRQMHGLINDVAHDDTVRVLLLTGEGDKSFIAGADISEFVGATPSDALVIARRINAITDAIVGMRKPVVAVVNGYCLGGGLELALACDIRIAAMNATFGLPEIKLGILPGGGGTVRLTKIAGLSVAKMMAMTGLPIDAQRAVNAGLLLSVHAPEELDAAARTLADRLAALPPFAMAQLKSSLNIAVDADTHSALETEIKAFALCYSTQDQEEGAAAFLEKRKPVFTGR